MGSRVSVTLSDTLRRRLEEAREKSGYTLSAEIEARLRDSLNHLGGDNLLLVRVDRGLLGWLGAFVDGCGFFGDMSQTANHLIRAQLDEMMKHDCWYGPTVPLLPSPWRESNMEAPRWRALQKRAEF